MQEKKIIIASDHAGFALKEQIKNYLSELGWQVLDKGPQTDSVSVDYPDYAVLLAQDIHTGAGNKGILICGSGIGMSIAVNRFPFIRGALVTTPEMAHLARQHNDANVLIFGGRMTDWSTVKQALNEFLTTPFEGGRHIQRITKLERIK